MRLSGGGLFGIAIAVAVGALLSACAGGSAPTPTPVSQLLVAGLAAETAGQTQAAIDDFQAVLKQDPGNKYALYNLGLISDQQQHNTVAGEADYRAALISDPNYVPALFNLAILRTAAAPYEAIDLYRHVIAVQASYAAAHLNLGYVLRALGQTSEGNAEIATAVSMQPSLAATANATSSAKASASPTAH